MKSFDNEWEKIHASQEWGKYPSENVIRFIARNYYSKDRLKTRILDFDVEQVQIRGIWQKRDLMYMRLMVR